MATLTLLFAVLFAALMPPAPATLYAQSVQAALAHIRLPPHTEYLLMDLRTRELLASTFASPDTPVPAGSLLKPFLAYAAELQPLSPVPCKDSSNACQKAALPCKLSLTEALAQSSNPCFLAFASRIPPAQLTLTAKRLGLPAPPPDASPETLIGLTPAWSIAPRTLALAYANLLAAQPSPALLAGLQAAATHGTARRVGLHPGGVLAKTGTAPCIDSYCRANGDGWTVALTPAADPTLLLLIRRRATNGATTAETAGRILTVIERLHAH